MQEYSEFLRNGIIILMSTYLYKQMKSSKLFESDGKQFAFSGVRICQLCCVVKTVPYGKSKNVSSFSKPYLFISTWKHTNNFIDSQPCNWRCRRSSTPSSRSISASGGHHEVSHICLQLSLFLWGTMTAAQYLLR